MDYEQLYQEMQLLEKDMKDKLAATQRMLKNVIKNSEKGDLKSVAKDLSQMRGFVKEYESFADDYQNLLLSFDTKEYMESGEFAKQILRHCESLDVDIKGEFPTYEMFPYKVRIDSENEELYVDRKKVQCVRPQYFVKSIKQSQERLNKASFNVATFLNELAEAYTAAIKCKEKMNRTAKADQDVLLKDIYSYLVPMQRFRREYDMQSYAFDLARLYNSDVELTKDGRRFQFGQSRASGKLIRILDKEGREQFLGTIRFFDPES